MWIVAAANETVAWETRKIYIKFQKKKRLAWPSKWTSFIHALANPCLIPSLSDLKNNTNSCTKNTVRGRSTWMHTTSASCFFSAQRLQHWWWLTLCFCVFDIIETRFRSFILRLEKERKERTSCWSVINHEIYRFHQVKRSQEEEDRGMCVLMRRIWTESSSNSSRIRSIQEENKNCFFL